MECGRNVYCNSVTVKTLPEGEEGPRFTAAPEVWKTRILTPAPAFRNATVDTCGTVAGSVDGVSQVTPMIVGVGASIRRHWRPVAAANAAHWTGGRDEIGPRHRYCVRAGRGRIDATTDVVCRGLPGVHVLTEAACDRYGTGSSTDSEPYLANGQRRKAGRSAEERERAIAAAAVSPGALAVRRADARRDVHRTPARGRDDREVQTDGAIGIEDADARPHCLSSSRHTGRPNHRG